MEIRTSALLAGAGILVICFVAGYGEVSRQQILRDLGMDLYGAAITEDLGSANVAGALLTVCYCFLVVGVVDIGVAFSLYSWLDVSSNSLALFVAWLRVAYTSDVRATLKRRFGCFGLSEAAELPNVQRRPITVSRHG